MVKTIKNIFKKNKGSKFNYEKDIKSLSNDNAVFELKYKNLLIGTLEFKFKEQEWHFEYSAEFKSQNKIAPILSFPDTNKVYSGKELWSFFSSRIPDNVGESSEIKEKNANSSLIDLLKSYGQKTITNPFDLSVA
ncbi:MAG: HipA N-terminal domain-containing protein [Brumimicrobium sp.]